MQLNNLERAVLETAVAGSGDGSEQLQRQIRDLKVERRDYTGVGFVVDFCPIEDELRTHAPDRDLINVEGRSDALQRGFGCVVFIRDGQISTLECFSYEEPWPKDLGTYRILRGTVTSVKE